MLTKLRKKFFTLNSFSLGFNDPYIAGVKSLSYFSYIRYISRLRLKWILIDVGAHSGTFVDRVSKRIKFAKIILCEPNSEHIQTLQDKYPGSVIKQKAVAKKTGFTYYFRHSWNSGQNYTSNSKKSKEIVSTITINSLFKETLNMDNWVFLKIDIEGNELEILKTLSKSNWEKIGIISCEIHFCNDTYLPIDQLNRFVPKNFEYFRETRFGLYPLNRIKPHWTDQLNLFQNLILINKDLNIV